MYRKVKVLLHGVHAGDLTQQDDQYAFQYLADYTGPRISLSLPVRAEPYVSQGVLHPYFSSLAPEGWLRRVYSNQQKIDEQDLLGILMENGDNLLGAIEIKGY
ncbi:HipA N-terminal domain-containing protein [Shewanella sp. C32]|uniref:HipA N-terminal domain-containing protein n=1 Tax=Shewanella electrica TaxID=515560 RepID=A0ABT2FPZ5_9GAMM|nr:HipA N-terminal domain-containing protein [Shewanella electrica]MCH1925756.1 HipA N-terminal domain-containing protein [Shewanella electrica]MCS4558417.1 HipA N-terminal domain-containing protein [Shewanella electrica]